MPTVCEKAEPAAYVERIREGDPSGIDALCKIYYRGIRFFVARHLGPEEADDRAHDAILIVVQAIRRGELRDPNCLPGYIRTVVRHLVATQIGRRIEARRRQVALESALETGDSHADPEAAAAAQERTEIMREILTGLSQRDREVLTRFYLLEQTKYQICQEMGLTGTQFRLLKSRAKARFAKLAQVGATIHRTYM
mgnify:CR=1 FL=1